MHEQAPSATLEVDVARLFHALFMRMAEAVALYQMVCDLAGRPVNYRIIEVNPEYEKLSGRRREQLIGKLADQAYGTTEPPHLALYGKVVFEGSPTRFDEYFATLGRHYEVSVAAMGSGFFSTVLNDVTDRRQQEKASREAEWFLERSQIVGRLGSYRFDADSGTWVGSGGLYDVFGITPAFQKDVGGWLGLVHPEDRENMRNYLAEHVLSEGHSFDRRYRIIRHDNGELRWVHGRGELEKDAAGVPHYMIGTIQDITESVQIEQALRRKSEELDRIFSLTLDMLCIASLDGRLLRVNAAWTRVLGWSVAELEGSHYLDFIHTEDLATTRQAMRELEGGKDLIDLTNRCRCKDGSYRFVEWRSAPAGGVIYAAARDVSERERSHAERQRLEQQLLQSQKMESVGLLAGGIAHDFNNLLTVILACTDELVVRLVHDDESQSLLTDVMQASQRAAELTRQLLAFSRQQVLLPRVLDLNHVVFGVTRMLSRMLGETIELLSKPGPDVEPIFADPGQLEQIIVNLAVNARDAMPDGGRLILETYNQPQGTTFDDATELEPSGYVVLAVHDTGVGMDEATRRRIFEPFFTTKGELGTGLGLATVYGIVKQSGGHIAVESVPGRGTTFLLYLPRAGVAAASLLPAQVRGKRLIGHETVLLVEDETLVRTVLKKVLLGAGYEVLEAANADEALRANAERGGRVDVLLTDVVMPGKTGRQLAEQLVSERPSLGVIYMSGYAPNAALPSAELEDGSAFLQKPIRSLQLLSKLREVLDSRQETSK